MTARTRALDVCGCCEAAVPTTPVEVHNRPSLEAISYRAGTYASFREAMIRAIPRTDRNLATELTLPTSPLARWTARTSDDFGMSVLEMWATLADILTFYQERIANEAFLRTAVQRDSVRRLAAMLDYALNPGVSAGTLVAYVLDAGAVLDIPERLKAQSVPQQGQTPQRFETVESIRARSDLNSVRIYPQPTSDDPLVQNRTSGTLKAGSAVPSPGERVLVFQAGVAGVEEKTIETAETVEGRTTVRWSPRIRGSGWTDMASSMTPYGRIFRAFGSDAPADYVAPTVGSMPVTWSWRTTPFTITGNEIPLDGVYEDFKVGTRVVLTTPGATYVRTVTGVKQKVQTDPPGTATMLTIDGSALPSVDRRELRVYELIADDLDFQGWTVGSEIPAGTATLYAPRDALEKIEARRWILVDDHRGEPDLVRVTADGSDHHAEPGGEPEFLAIPVSPATTRMLDAGTSVLVGNVARATHGETVSPEAVGDGDASQAFQSFGLKKSPLTRVRSSTAAGGAKSTLSLRVDQVEWREVDSLYGHRGGERVYTTDLGDSGNTIVRFGDGITGARLTTGSKNVTALYRQGLGDAGNVDAGAITTALDRPVGLKAVTNPVPATGGTDPESPEGARRNAPSTVRTFDRAISLRDFEDLALGFAGVAKAAAVTVWDGEIQIVHLTVAGPKGAGLSATDQDALLDYLDLRRDPNKVVAIDAYVAVALRLEAVVRAEPDRTNSMVETVARAAVDRLFSFEVRRFGQAAHLSDVYAGLQEVEGVVSVDVNVFTYKDPAVAADHAGSTAPLLAHLPIAVARPNPGSPPPKIFPSELAVIENPADVQIVVTRGLTS
jgi:hypothetical protein